MTESTSQVPADPSHPTGGPRRARGAEQARRGRPTQSNYRLWILVAALLLLLPAVVVGVRGLGAADDAGVAAAPGTAVPAPAETPTEAPGPDADAEADEKAEQEEAAREKAEKDAAEKKAAEEKKKAEKKKPAKKKVEVPASGPAEYATVDRPTKPAGERGRLLRYRVLVEKNLDLDLTATADEIAGILNDERSWRGDGSVRFELVPPGDRVDFTIYVVTPGTTDDLCAPLLTRGDVSCRNGDNVVLNALRWVDGAEAYGDDVTAYRQYLVNHEVGHRLGYGHVSCPARGAKAPVMMQQTKGVAGCKPDPWVKSSDR